MRRREKVMSSLAIFGAFLGGVGLILLSIFDTKRHPKLHRVFLLLFVLGAALSAIFTVIEVNLQFLLRVIRVLTYRFIVSLA